MDHNLSLGLNDQAQAHVHFLICLLFSFNFILSFCWKVCCFWLYHGFIIAAVTDYIRDVKLSWHPTQHSTTYMKSTKAASTMICLKNKLDSHSSVLPDYLSDLTTRQEPKYEENKYSDQLYVLQTICYTGVVYFYIQPICVVLLLPLTVTHVTHRPHINFDQSFSFPGPEVLLAKFFLPQQCHLWPLITWVKTWGSSACWEQKGAIVEYVLNLFGASVPDEIRAAL